MDWCDGIISTPALHRYVTAVIADKVKHPFLDRLKSIATTDVGKQAQKELCDLLLDFCGMKDVLEFDGESWCVPPSRYFSVIHKTSRASFETLLGANRDLLRKCWTDLFASADGQELRSLHPHLRGMEPEDLECVIPLVLFEDAAPYSKSKGCNAIIISSLLGRGSERLTKYVYATYINEKASNDPDEALWSLLFRDIELLYQGKGYNSDGNDIAVDPDGCVWRFTLLFGEGDMKNHCDSWGLVSYNYIDKICQWCDADRFGTPFTDLRDHALWRASLPQSNDTYLSKLRRPLHPVAKSIFMNKYFVRLDHMHVSDLKGVTGIVGGGVIRKCLELPCLGANQQLRLDELNRLKGVFCRNRPRSHRMPSIRLTNLTADDGWTCLGGPCIKVSNTRAIAPWFEHFVATNFPGNDDESRCLRIVTSQLNRMYEILYSSGLFLTTAQETEFALANLSFGKHFMLLREFAAKDGIAFSAYSEGTLSPTLSCCVCVGQLDVHTTPCT